MALLGAFGRIGGLLTSVGSLASPSGFRAVENLILPQVRTFKDYDVLRRRCKDCYFKKDDYRWYVLCPTHGRHKQRQKINDWRQFWIVTHKTHGPRKRF